MKDIKTLYDLWSNLNQNVSENLVSGPRPPDRSHGAEARWGEAGDGYWGRGRLEIEANG